MKFLFAMDGSEGAEDAADFLCSLPSSGNSVTVAGISELPDVVSMPQTVETNAWQLAVQDFQKQTQKHIDNACNQFKNNNWQTSDTLRVGYPSDQILESAKNAEADVICVGSRGLKGVKKLFLGSISQRVLIEADRPVLLAHKRKNPEQTLKVMLAWDGSNDATKAKEFLKKFPLPENSTLVTVHAVEMHDAFSQEMVESLKDWPQFFKDLNASTNSIAEEMQSHFKVSDAKTFETQSKAYQAIIDHAEAKNIDLIVLGNSGKNSLSRFMMGSVSLQTALHANCSVLVVK